MRCRIAVGFAAAVMEWINSLLPENSVILRPRDGVSVGNMHAGRRTPWLFPMQPALFSRQEAKSGIKHNKDMRTLLACTALLLVACSSLHAQDSSPNAAS